MTGTVLASSQVWWFVARAGGITGWVLSVLAVLWGLALSTRAFGSRPRAPWLLDLHRFLGGLTCVFIGVHVLGLVADSYVQIGWAEVLVPLKSSYKPVAVAWGIVAFYLLVAVEVTSLLRNRIPTRFWKGVHFSSYALYAFATVHLLFSGTDASNPLLRWGVWVSVMLVVFFTLYRVLGPGRIASARSGRTKSGGARSGGPRVPDVVRSPHL